METIETRTPINEAMFEQMVDRAVWRRLDIDSAYKFAEDAEVQAEREQLVTDQEIARLSKRYEVQ